MSQSTASIPLADQQPIASATAAAIVYTWRKLHTLTRRTATARA